MPKRYIIKCFSNGNNCPVDKFIDGLGEREKKKMMDVLRKLESNGPLLSNPDKESLGNGLLQLRAYVNKVQYRIIYIRVNGIYILLEGFIKKSRKTPEKNKNNAKKRLKEYNKGIRK